VTGRLPTRLLGSRSGISREDRGAQIVEFAVALPLLVVFVVGIFDFSGAFTLKQKLTNAARDAARTAAADPANDLTQPSAPSGLPVSVNDAYQTVQNYMLANNIPNCGIAPPASPTGLSWTFAPSSGTCTAGVQKLIINRGYYFAQTGGSGLPPADCSAGSAGSAAVIATCISIQFVYPWKFGQVASLLGSATTLPTTLTVTAVAMNEN